MNETATCPQCKTTKPLDKFYRDKRSRNGKTSWCKECIKSYARSNAEYRSQYAKEWYQRPGNAERMSDNAKRWREQNPERHAELIRRGSLRNRFGMTLEEYDQLLASQGGGCAICGKTEEENGKRLGVDHDHKCCPKQYACGTCNRGILCDDCNKLIGALENNAHHLEAAHAYLSRYGPSVLASTSCPVPGSTT